MLKNIKKRLKDQHGLTLVELLAVIVILGIVAAIAVPSVGGIINKSKEDAKVAEALQIINAAKMAHTSNSKIKVWTADGTPPSGVAAADAAALQDYLSNVEDTDYTVTYKEGTKEYSIRNHEAYKVVNDVTTEGIISEKELLQHSGAK